MGSVFDSAGNEEIRGRIRRLTPESAPRWGKMSSAQMLAHCRRPIEVAFGERTIRRGFVGLLFGGFFKKRVINGAMPFRPNLPTDPGFLVVDERDFEAEREGLLRQVERFAGAGADLLTRDPHPFFGNMNPQEWDRLMWKHLDHHLRQFGA